MTNIQLAFNLYQTLNNANPQLNGSIGAADTALALKTGHGSRLPAILSGTATSTGDKRTLNDTGDLGSLAAGDWIHNVTDGSWAIVIDAVSANQVRTTPLRGGSDNTWSNGDTWAKGRFVATLISLDANGDIDKSERVLVTAHAAASDNVTVTRSFDGDTALTFAANDYLMLFVMEEHLEESKKAIAQTFVLIDEIDRGTHSTAAEGGSSNAFTLTLDPPVTDLDDIIGKPIMFKATHSNSAASTFNLNGLGAVAIKKLDGATDLEETDIQSGQMVIVIYDGTYFQMVTPSGNAAGDTAFGATASDPAAGTLQEGQTWYNSTSNLFKMWDGVHDEIGTTTWAAGGNLSTVSRAHGSAGSDSAGLIGFGITTSSSASNNANTQEYNGTSWAGGGTGSTNRWRLGSFGSQVASLFYGGSTIGTNLNSSEAYDGSSFAAGGNLSRAAIYTYGCGTLAAGLSVGGGRNDSSAFDTTTEEYDGASFAAGGALPTGAQGLFVVGTQTAAVSAGGQTASAPTYTTLSQEYNGTSWSAGNAMTFSRYQGTFYGSSADSAFAIGGSGANAATETTAEWYNGTSWNTLSTYPLATFTGNGAGSSTAGWQAGGSNAAGSGTPYNNTYELSSLGSNTNIPIVMQTASYKSMGNRWETFSLTFTAAVMRFTPLATLTINLATVPPAGTEWHLQILTSGTSSFTITFGTNFKTTGTLATGTTSGKYFVIKFISDGTQLMELSRTTAI